jgi:hypothetical protein
MPDKIIPIRSSTQKFTEIEDVVDDLIMFTDGSCAMIMSTTAVNFGLLSEKEQESLIYAYAGLLNSLQFPIQLVIRTERKDVSSYLTQLESQAEKQSNLKLKSSINSYRLFVSTMVKERNVLDKKFYIVLPFSALEIGPSTSVLVGSKKRGLPAPKEQILNRAQTTLAPKRDQVTRLMGRIGLKAEQLSGQQIIKLYFSIFNPDTPIPDFSQSDIAAIKSGLEKT